MLLMCGLLFSMAACSSENNTGGENGGSEKDQQSNELSESDDNNNQEEDEGQFGEFKGVMKDLELKDVVMESTEKYAVLYSRNCGIFLLCGH